MENNNMKGSPLEKVVGGIMGFAIGDALGAPVEFKDQPHAVKDLEDSPSKGLKAGQFTDDTQQLLLVLDSLIANEGTINIGDMANRIVKLYNSPHIRSVGYTTKRAVENLRRGMLPNCSGLNGSGSLALPRVIPYSILSSLVSYNNKIDTSDIRKIMKITHDNKEVFKMGFLVNYYIQEMMNGKTCSEVTDQIVHENYFLNKKIRDKIGSVKGLAEQSGDRFKDIQKIGNTGFIEHVVYSSLYALQAGKDFKESVLIAANGTGDTDSRAAITGALAGIQYGISGIPSEWISKVEQSKDLFSKSTQLYDLREKYL